MLQKVVVGMLTRGDKVLVALRPEGKPYSGYWEFPGGKIEAAESGKEALIRELQEELGILATEVEFCFSHTHDYPDKSVFLEVWRVLEFEGNPRGAEDQQLRWVDLDEIATLRILSGNIAILDKIRALLV